MRVGLGDAWRAMRTPEGPATLHVRSHGYDIKAEAWGPGAGWALDSAAGLVGALDDDSGFEPHHDVVAELWRHNRGVHVTQSGAVMHALIPTILEQKVTGHEARRAYRAMVLATSEPAPGETGLYLPPDPARLAETPYFAFHPWGVEQRRAETVRETCAQAARLEAGTSLTLDQANARLLAHPRRGAVDGGGGRPDGARRRRRDLGRATSTCRTPCAGRSRVSRAEPTSGCSSCWSRTGVNVVACKLLLDAGNISAPAYGPRMEVGNIERI